MNKIYGAPPVDLGLFDMSPKEMMCWLYCPIKLPGDFAVFIPPNLTQFGELVRAVENDCSINRWKDSYVYITAKTLFVTASNPGNRPGWHSDGFMTDDLNYIWSDCNGTVFWLPDNLVNFVQDHADSLEEMEAAAHVGPHVVYRDKHLLKLDQSVIHRVADVVVPKMRTFVKISVSRQMYDLVGNSVNHDLAPNWVYKERSETRNCPSSDENKSA